MTRHLALIRAVFIKDLRLLWPLALLSIAIILASHLLKSDYRLIAFFLPMAAALVPALFLLGLVQHDAPASLRHDWLTRPVGTHHLLIAKAAAAALVVLVPALLGPVLAATVNGTSIPEALLMGLAGLEQYVVVAFFLVLVGAITTSLLQAAAVILGLFLLLVIAAPMLLPISGLSQGVMSLGSGWVAVLAFQLVIAIGGIAALWFQYYMRSTAAVRSALAGTIGVSAVLMATFGWSAVNAAQALVTGDTAPEGFAIASARDCFDAQFVDAQPLDAPSGRNSPWDEEQLRAAGAQPLGFWSAVQGEGLPAGWRFSAAHVSGRFIDAHGKSLATVEPARFYTDWRSASGDRLEAWHPWLIPHGQFDALKTGVHAFQVDYVLNLLAPVHQGDLAVDNQPHAIPNFGKCTASRLSSTDIQVICFKAGEQPQYLTVIPVGAPADREVGFGALNLAPAILRQKAGARYMAMARMDGASATPRVRIKAYEVRAHLTRRVTMPGMPGTPARACPARTARASGGDNVG